MGEFSLFQIKSNLTEKYVAFSIQKKVKFALQILSKYNYCANVVWGFSQK